jgi:hypothetical protein
MAWNWKTGDVVVYTGNGPMNDNYVQVGSTYFVGGVQRLQLRNRGNDNTTWGADEFIVASDLTTAAYKSITNNGKDAAYYGVSKEEMTEYLDSDAGRALMNRQASPRGSASKSGT